MKFTSVEFCAGAGGQAIGLEQAGFKHNALVEMDSHCCQTLRLNRPKWNVVETDLNEFDGRPYAGVDLIAAGLPCPPFSLAGKQLGEKDERNLFPAAFRLIGEIQPKAILIENVRGIMSAVFDDYRDEISTKLRKLGYEPSWRLMNASDFGVPQLRPRVNIVALRKDIWPYFEWPTAPILKNPPTVGETLVDLMASRGWEGAFAWHAMANEIAPTIVGGSKKHGGPDLGPTRAKRAWASLGVNAHTIAEDPPERGFEGLPRLTVRMVARIQGFPDDWQFVGKKTAAYRQVGNAFPPPVACAVGKSIAAALKAAAKSNLRSAKHA